MRIKSVASVKPRTGKAQRTTQTIIDPGITYNQAGISYNEATIQYGGVANPSQIFGNKPIVAKIEEPKGKVIKSVDRGQSSFYRGMPYGLLLSLTYPS